MSSAILLVRKSSLCGSNELDETLKAAYETMRTFFNSYMKTPSKELKQELTKAFDTGDREDAAARLEETQESLDRMLKEYVKNATKPGFSESLTRAYQSVGDDCAAMKMNTPEEEEEAKKRRLISTQCRS